MQLPDNVRLIFDRLEKLDQEKTTGAKVLYVVKGRFGFFGRILTLEEIGQKYDLTRERIRQIEDKALMDIRKLSIEYNLGADSVINFLNSYKKHIKSIPKTPKTPRIVSDTEISNLRARVSVGMQTLDSVGISLDETTMHS